MFTLRNYFRHVISYIHSQYDSVIDIEKKKARLLRECNKPNSTEKSFVLLKDFIRHKQKPLLLSVEGDIRHYTKNHYRLIKALMKKHDEKAYGYYHFIDKEVEKIEPYLKKLQLYTDYLIHAPNIITFRRYYAKEQEIYTEIGYQLRPAEHELRKTITSLPISTPAKNRFLSLMERVFGLRWLCTFMLLNALLTPFTILSIKAVQELSTQKEIDAIAHELVLPKVDDEGYVKLQHVHMADVHFVSSVDERVRVLQEYIDTRFPKSPMKAKDIIEAADTYHISPTFIMAVAQAESRFMTDPDARRARAYNSPFGMGNYDDGRNLFHFKDTREAVFAYARLIRNEYLVNGRTENDLVSKDGSSFVNYAGNRYASKPDYESFVRGIWDTIRHRTGMS